MSKRKKRDNPHRRDPGNTLGRWDVDVIQATDMLAIYLQDEISDDPVYVREQVLGASHIALSKMTTAELERPRTVPGKAEPVIPVALFLRTVLDRHRVDYSDPNVEQAVIKLVDFRLDQTLADDRQLDPCRTLVHGQTLPSDLKPGPRMGWEARTRLTTDVIVGRLIHARNRTHAEVREKVIGYARAALGDDPGKGMFTDAVLGPGKQPDVIISTPGLYRMVLVNSMLKYHDTSVAEGVIDD